MSKQNILIHSPYFSIWANARNNFARNLTYYLVPIAIAFGIIRVNFSVSFPLYSNIAQVWLVIIALVIGVSKLSQAKWYASIKPLGNANYDKSANKAFPFIYEEEGKLFINTPKSFFAFGNIIAKPEDLKWEVKEKTAIIKIGQRVIKYPIWHLADGNGILLNGYDWPSKDKAHDLENNDWSELDFSRPEVVEMAKREAKRGAFASLLPY